MKIKVTLDDQPLAFVSRQPPATKQPNADFPCRKHKNSQICTRASTTSAVAAAFLLEGWIDPDRIRVETSQLPAPGQLAPAPAVSIRIAGG